MTIDRAALIAYVAEHNRRATFDGQIEDLERICHRHLPKRGEAPPPESLPWYAQEIIFAIGTVRHWVAQGQADVAASEAVVVGMLAARAGARHNWPEVKRWNAHAATLRRGSQAGVETNRHNAAKRAAALRADVVAYRLKHPESSANQIALALLRTHGRGSGEREKDLAALAKRINRLDPKK